MSHRPSPAWQRPRPRGVYRVRSDRPGLECWVVWSRDTRLLACSYLAPGHDVIETKAKFNQWLEGEDPALAASVSRATPPTLRLIRAG